MRLFAKLVVIVVAGQLHQRQAPAHAGGMQLVEQAQRPIAVAGVAHLGRVAVQPQLVGGLDQGGQMPDFQRRKAQMQVGEHEHVNGSLHACVLSAAKLRR